MVIEVSEEKIAALLERYASHPSVHDAIMEIIRPENLKFKTLDLSQVNSDMLVNAFTSGGLSPLLELRTGGQFANRSLILWHQYNWDIIKEGGGSLLLVPTKRQNNNNAQLIN